MFSVKCAGCRIPCRIPCGAQSFLNRLPAETFLQEEDVGWELKSAKSWPNRCEEKIMNRCESKTPCHESGIQMAAKFKFDPMLLCYYGGSGDDDRHLTSHSTSFASQEDLREAIVAVCDPAMLFDHFAA